MGILMVAAGGPIGAVWAPPVSFAVAAVIYGAALSVSKPGWFTMDRPHDPRDEVDDMWEARMRCHACGDSYIAYEMDRDPSAGHQPICLACASDAIGFQRAADKEAAGHLSG